MMYSIIKQQDLQFKAQVHCQDGVQEQIYSKLLDAESYVIMNALIYNNAVITSSDISYFEERPVTMLRNMPIQRKDITGKYVLCYYNNDYFGWGQVTSPQQFHKIAELWNQCTRYGTQMTDRHGKNFYRIMKESDGKLLPKIENFVLHK